LQRLKKTVREKRPQNKSMLPKLFVWVLLCIGLIPVCAVLVLHVPAVQEWVLKEVLRKLETSAGIGVELDSFRWSPFRELHVFGLKVKASGENVLECEEAALDYRLSWSWPYIHPKGIALEKPWLQLERDSEGHFQLSPGKSKEPGDSRGSKSVPWASLPWPQIRINSGSIIAYQDGQVVLSVRDVNATFFFEEVAGSDGPKLKINFGPWQGCIDVPELGEWRLTGAAEIEGQTIRVSQLEVNAPKVAELFSQGWWNLTSPFDGALQIQVMRLTPMVFPPLPEKFSALKEISGSMRLARQSGEWSLDHELQSNLGSLHGTLKVEPNTAGGRFIQLISRFSDLHLAVPSQPAEAHLSGQIEFTMEGSQLPTAQARLVALVESSTWGDQTIHKGELRGSYEQGVAEIKTSKIQSSLGDFNFFGRADLRGLWDRHHQGEVKFDLRAERANLGKIVSGTAQRFGGSVVYEGHYGAGDFTSWERWQGKMEANLSLPELLTLKASGHQKNDSVALEYDLGIHDLQKLAGVIPSWRGRGKVTSRGSINGRWPDLVWEGTVSSPSFQVGPVQGEQASLKGKGKILGKEGRRELTLKVQNLSADGKKLGAWNLDLQQEADACRFNVKGEGALVHGSAKLSGRLEKMWGPVRTLLVNQSALSWKNQSASLDARIEAGHDGIRVQSVTMQHNKEKLLLAGEIWFDARTDLKLTLDGVDLGQWAQVFALPNLVSGTASGQVSVKGRTDQPEASLSLLLTHGTIAVPKSRDETTNASRPLKAASTGTVIDRLQLQGAFVKDTLSIQGDLQSQAVQNPVHLSAKIPMHLSLQPPRLEISRTEQWAFSFKIGGLQAASILPYVTVLQTLGGRVDLDAEGGGTLSQPLIAATGAWRDGSMIIRKWPNPVEKIQVDWQADARQITISKSAMELLGGHVEVKGRVSYPAFQEMDFEANGMDLEAKDIYGIRGKVAGRARLTATATGGKLTADLDLTKAEMDLGQFETGMARNIRVIDADSKGDIVEVRKETTDQDTFYNRMEMDLTINLPSSGTWVRGMGLDAEITGTLKIEKRPFSALRLRGGFQTLRGEYRFQDYKLKIVDGELIFPDSPQPDPQLKIVCQKDVKDAIIQVQVTGPLKKPKLVMSSMPSMNQVDILSYLLFDRPAGDLSSRESFQLQDKAASWLGSQTSQLLKRVLGNTLLTPDTIEYRKGLSKTPGSSGTKAEVGVVSIGKYVTPDLYVNFEKSVIGEEGNEVDVEYRLNRNLSIQTQFGGTTQSGIDIFWRYDFGN
jgi:autotransporter translocation and assembly factor TamB